MLKRIIKSLFTSLAILAPVLATAAEKTAHGKGSEMNAMLIGLVALIIVLLFTIGILGNVLRQLALVYKEKLRKERSKVIAPVALLFIMLLGTAAHAEEALAVAAPQAPAYISGIAASDFYLLIGIIALEMLVILSMLLSMRVLVRLLSNKP